MLFRKAIYEKRANQHLGDVSLYTPPSFWWIAYVLSALIFGVICLLIWGGYAQKERVIGVLMPSEGLVRIAPYQSGRFEAVYVSVGQRVNSGDPLFKIRNQTVLQDGSYLTEELLLKMEKELAYLNQTFSNIHKQYALMENRLNIEKQQLLSELDQISMHIDLSQKLIDIEKQRFLKIDKLFQNNAASKIELINIEKSLLQAEQSYNNYITNQLRIASKIEDVEEQLTLLPIQKSNNERELQAQINAVEKTILQGQANENFVINAPVSGVVASLVARKGQQASPQKIAVSILPEGGRLEAELYVPVRAIGFVDEGQLVRLRYDAFPYQKFGIYEGVISEISKTVIESIDLAIMPKINEPFFLVVVAIEQQSINAYNKTIPLQPGMSLSADIILEKRKLWEWFFEPLIGVSKEL